MKIKALLTVSLCLWVLQGHCTPSLPQLNTDSIDLTQITQDWLEPLHVDFPELYWYLPHNDAATSEGFEQKNEHFLSYFKQTMDKSPSIEHTRTLGSLLYLALFTQGGDGCYDFITSAQRRCKLTRAQFDKLHELAQNTLTSKDWQGAAIALLIYSDLGKTTHFQNLMDQDKLDPDYLLLKASQSGNMANLLPSLGKLSPATKAIVAQALTAPSLHLGHALHMELSPAQLAQYSQAKNEHTAAKQIYDLQYLVHMCDVAAAVSHLKLTGSLALDAPTTRGYELLYQTLNDETLEDDDLYTHYWEARATDLGLDYTQTKERLLARLATLMRAYGKSDGLLLKLHCAQFNHKHWAELRAIFDLDGTLNGFAHTPTYMPIYLINLMAIYDKSSNRANQINHGLQGALQLAKIIKLHADSIEQSDSPTSFNTLAKAAASRRNWFLNRFDVKFINLNHNQLTHLWIKNFPVA